MFYNDGEHIRSIIALATLLKLLLTKPWQLSLPSIRWKTSTFSFILFRIFSSHRRRRRRIVSFNLALFILLFALVFLFTWWQWGAGGREKDENHARYYPTPKLLRLLCFMRNAITFIPLVVKIYFFGFLSLNWGRMRKKFHSLSLEWTS